MKRDDYHGFVGNGQGEGIETTGWCDKGTVDAVIAGIIVKA